MSTWKPEEHGGMSEAVQMYLTTALWSSTGDDDEPLDSEHDAYDFDSDSKKKAARDLDRFIKMVSDTVELFPNKQGLNFNDTDLAHDLWLSRNGHGSGFFDRPEKYGLLTTTFQELAKSLGEQYAYVGDDGKVYLS